jgi:hypothetical protein
VYRLVKLFAKSLVVVADLAGCWEMKTDHNRLGFDYCSLYYELPVESMRPNRR